MRYICDQNFDSNSELQYHINDMILDNQTEALLSTDSFNEEYYDLFIEPQIIVLLEKNGFSDFIEYKADAEEPTEVEYDDKLLQQNIKDESFPEQNMYHFKMDTALTLKQEIHEVTEKEIIKDEYNFKSCKKYIKFFKNIFDISKLLRKISSKFVLIVF